jgi:hypothetical protein
VGDDSSDGCERIFDAVVEFGIQDFAGLFGPLSLGDIDADPDHPLRARITIVRNETTPFGPTDLTV